MTTASRAAAAPPVRDHAAERRWVGRSIRRVEDPKFLRGQGGYIADRITPGTLHAAVLRSPYAHARILRVDTSRARAAQELRVLDAADGPADPAPLGGVVPDRGSGRRAAAGGHGATSFGSRIRAAAASTASAMN